MSRDKDLATARERLHGEMVELNDSEPPPVPTTERPVWDMVIDDMRERDRVGTEKYGTPLQAGNGRDHLVDAYQEALDLVVYLRAEIAARHGSEPHRQAEAKLERVHEVLNRPGYHATGQHYAEAVEDALEVLDAD